MVTEGCRLAQEPGLQLPISPMQYTELARHQTIRDQPLPNNMRALRFDKIWLRTRDLVSVDRQLATGLRELFTGLATLEKNSPRMLNCWIFWTQTFQFWLQIPNAPSTL